VSQILYKMWQGFSWKFRVISHRHKSTAVWSKLTPNSMTIPCHLYSFYKFSILKHDMDFGQVQVMEFPWGLLRKWWDFPCGFGVIVDQTAVKKTWGSPCHIFYREIIQFQKARALRELGRGARWQLSRSWQICFFMNIRLNYCNHHYNMKEWNYNLLPIFPKKRGLWILSYFRLKS